MHRKKNEPLANGGWKAAFAGMKADNKEKVLINSFLKPFPRNAYSKFVCELCHACSSDEFPFLSYADVSQDAGWRPTMVTTDSYRRICECRRCPTSPMLDMPGWTLKRNLPDFLHNGYLGSCGDACAACLWAMCLLGDLGSDYNLGLRALWIK